MRGVRSRSTGLSVSGFPTRSGLRASYGLLYRWPCRWTRVHEASALSACIGGNRNAFPFSFLFSRTHTATFTLTLLVTCFALPFVIKIHVHDIHFANFPWYFSTMFRSYLLRCLDTFLTWLWFPTASLGNFRENFILYRTLECFFFFFFVRLEQQCDFSPLWNLKQMFVDTVYKISKHYYVYTS